MWKNEKGKRKAGDSGKSQCKGNFNKTDFRKAMISAWGESESDAETETPKRKKQQTYVSWPRTKARMRNPKESRSK